MLRYIMLCCAMLCYVAWRGDAASSGDAAGETAQAQTRQPSEGPGWREVWREGQARWQTPWAPAPKALCASHALGRTLRALGPFALKNTSALRLNQACV